MTLDEVHELWGRDSSIDQSELSRESLRTPEVHHRWLKVLSHERLHLKKMEAALRVLRHKKTVFYTQGPDEETRQLGWRLPPRGKLLKTEVSPYVDCDPDVLRAGELVAEQAEVVDAVEQVLKMVSNRGFQIKNAIDHQRFLAGQ